MTQPEPHPLLSVKALLAEAARHDDPQPLAGVLSGRHLPPMGGDQHPAELVYRALILPPVEADLAEWVARALAALCGELVKSQALPDELDVFNLLLLASFLPGDPELFAALKRLFETGLAEQLAVVDGGRASRQLRQALAVQQTDGSLEDSWLGLMGRPGDGRSLSSQREGELLDAWTGILWLPETDADLVAGRSPSLVRVERGLLRLYEVVEDAPEGPGLVRYALQQLDEAYPRSPEFWAECLQARALAWPGPLRDLVAKQWPLCAVAGRREAASMSNPQPTQNRPRPSLEGEPWMVTIQLLRDSDAGEEWFAEVAVVMGDPGSAFPARMRAVLVAERDQFTVSQPTAGFETAKIALFMPDHIVGLRESQPAATVTVTVRGPGQLDSGGASRVKHFRPVPLSADPAAEPKLVRPGKRRGAW